MLQNATITTVADCADYVDCDGRASGDTGGDLSPDTADKRKRAFREEELQAKFMVKSLHRQLMSNVIEHRGRKVLVAGKHQFKSLWFRDTAFALLAILEEYERATEESIASNAPSRGCRRDYDVFLEDIYDDCRDVVIDTIELYLEHVNESNVGPKCLDVTNPEFRTVKRCAAFTLTRDTVFWDRITRFRAHSDAAPPLLSLIASVTAFHQSHRLPEPQSNEPFDTALLQQVLDESCAGRFRLPPLVYRKSTYPAKAKLVPFYVDSRGSTHVDGNILVCMLAATFMRCERRRAEGPPPSQVKSLFARTKPLLYWYEGVAQMFLLKEPHLIIQDRYADWQDSQNRGHTVFFTNLLFWRCLVLIGKHTLAERQRQLIHYVFYDASSGLYASTPRVSYPHPEDPTFAQTQFPRGIFGEEKRRRKLAKNCRNTKSPSARPHFSLEDQLFAIKWDFVHPHYAEEIGAYYPYVEHERTLPDIPSRASFYHKLSKHPLWTSRAVPGFPTFPSYTTRPHWQVLSGGLRNYHDSLHWSWVTSLAGEVAFHVADFDSAMSIYNAVRKTNAKHKCIHEVYVLRDRTKELIPFTSKTYHSEFPWTWGVANALVLALRRLAVLSS